jgi:serine/threonine-protein kinase
LFDEAQAALAASKTEEACSKLEASQKLDAQLGTLLHLSACYERLGRVASAWSGWREAADWAGQRKDEREKIARKHAQELEPKVPWLTLRLLKAAPAGLEAKRDGAAVAAALLGSAVPVDPGTHHVEVTAPGFQKLERDVALAEGGRQVVEIDLLPLPTAGDPAAAPSAATPPLLSSSNAPANAAAPSDKGSGLQRPLGLALGGLGVVALGVGTYFGFDAKGKLSERDDVCPTRKGCTVAEGAKNEQLTKDARSSARFANIGWIGGAVLAAAGVTLWLTAPSKPSTTASARLTPWASAEVAGCVVEGAF